MSDGFWTYKEDATSKMHDHTYDEYIVVVQGQYDIIINSKVVSLKAGDEYLISKGIMHGGKAYAGTRAIYAFGGQRAKRDNSK